LTGNSNGFVATAGAVATGAARAGRDAAGAAAAGTPAALASPLLSGDPPPISEVRSPGSDTCCGSGNGSPGICGRLSWAWGSIPAGPVGVAAAGTAGVSPGIPVSGVVEAGTVDVKPGMPVVGAVEAGCVNPGIASVGAELVAGAVAPGMSDEAPGTALAACCGILIDALASGGGVAGCPPSAPARFCSACGAWAAVPTSCSPMLGVGTGAGSAWAVPIRPPMSMAADEPTTMVVPRRNIRTFDMTLPGYRGQASRLIVRLI
jgi:hypothetical protein